MPDTTIQELLDTLELLLAQTQAALRALPPENQAGRAAVSALGDLIQQAANEAEELAAQLEPGPPSPHTLSPRELQVLALVARGLTNKEVAYRLAISERTVQFHLHSVFNKTATHSRTEAAALAVKQGWIDLP